VLTPMSSSSHQQMSHDKTMGQSSVPCMISSMCYGWHCTGGTTLCAVSLPLWLQVQSYCEVHRKGKAISTRINIEHCALICGEPDICSLPCVLIHAGKAQCPTQLQPTSMPCCVKRRVRLTLSAAF
jgi:hypothetical protein